MTVRGHRVPMAFALLVWCIVWEIVGQLGANRLIPPFTDVLSAMVEIVPTSDFVEAASITLQAFLIGMALSLVVGIGAGILMVEVQEPTDLSVLLEWEGFELTEDDGHLGLGWDTALQALDRSAWDERGVAALRGPGAGRSLLPAAADPWFRAERVRGGDELDAGFSILVGLSGAGDLGGHGAFE